MSAVMLFYPNCSFLPSCAKIGYQQVQCKATCSKTNHKEQNINFPKCFIVNIAVNNNTVYSKFCESADQQLESSSYSCNHTAVVCQNAPEKKQFPSLLMLCCKCPHKILTRTEYHIPSDTVYLNQDVL